VVRRQADDARPDATGGAAHPEGERPGGRADELGRAAGELIAEKPLNPAATLWRVNCDGWAP